MQQKLKHLDALRDRLRGAIETLKEKDQRGSRAKELLAKVSHIIPCRVVYIVVATAGKSSCLYFSSKHSILHIP